MTAVQVALAGLAVDDHRCGMPEDSLGSSQSVHSGLAGVLSGLTVAVAAVKDPDKGGGHPDGCGQDDGEHEEERGSDGGGRIGLRGRAGGVVHHLRRGPGDGGARA